jgi:hypothetical protein
MVVNFTVEDEDISFRTRHWLLAGLEVQDGKSGVSKTNMLVQPNVVFIWAPMLLQSIHSLQHVRIGVSQYTCDATHSNTTGPTLLKECSKSKVFDYQSG